jgi:flagellar protein FlaJ
MAKKLLKEEYILFKNISVKLCGKTATKCLKYFGSLKKPVSSLKILFRTYISMMFFVPFLIYLISLVITIPIVLLTNIEMFWKIIYIVFIPVIAGSIAFTFMYIYPISEFRRRKRDIDFNLPFAITHMSAIASSGAPPYSIFKVLSQFEDYGEIANEAKRIIRNMDVFGLDEISAIKEVVSRTPSRELKEFLEGISMTIRSGGDLQKYLKERSDRAMFGYTIKRERYNQLLSTYADFYTALLIAAPLLFITILSILGVIGGSLFGLPIQDLIRIGVFGVIPILNIMFLVFIHLTQPRM